MKSPQKYHFALHVGHEVRAPFWQAAGLNAVVPKCKGVENAAPHSLVVTSAGALKLRGFSLCGWFLGEAKRTPSGENLFAASWMEGICGAGVRDLLCYCMVGKHNFASQGQLCAPKGLPVTRG